MSMNMGTIDRAARIFAALVVALLYLTGAIGGVVAVVLGVVALVLAVTAVAGRCPAYAAVGISTRRLPLDRP